MPEFARDALAKAVRRIGWAYLILHLNINLGTLNVLPSWLGFLMIVSSLSELSRWSPSAKLLRPLGYLLAAYEGAEWILTTLSVNISGGFLQSFSALAVLLTVLVRLYFHFQLLTDIANAAQTTDYDEASQLLRTRTWYTVLSTLLHLMAYLSALLNWIAVVLLVVNLVVAIVICRQILRFGKWLSEPFPAEPEMES